MFQNRWHLWLWGALFLVPHSILIAASGSGSRGTTGSIALSGNPLPLVISTATAGSQPDVATDTSTIWSVAVISVNSSGSGSGSATVTGKLDTAMPTGTTLKAQLTAPFGARSLGLITLTTTASSLVSGLTQSSSGKMQVTYQLSATMAAAPVSGQQVTVTFTLI